MDLYQRMAMSGRGSENAPLPHSGCPTIPAIVSVPPHGVSTPLSSKVSLPHAINEGSILSFRVSRLDQHLFAGTSRTSGVYKSVNFGDENAF